MTKKRRSSFVVHAQRAEAYWEKLRNTEYGIGGTYINTRKGRARAVNPYRVGRFSARTAPMQITTAEDELHTMLIPAAGGRNKRSNSWELPRSFGHFDRNKIYRSEL